MDPFICQGCGSHLFTVSRERGMLCLKCPGCDREHYTVLPADLYPWPEPEEGE